MKILLTGPTGQVGSALMRTLPKIGQVLPANRAKLDLTKADSIRQYIRSQRPEIIVNTAAYTAVDRAETEEDLASAVNTQGPLILAEEAEKLGALLVHYSTDYVFDGKKFFPYIETDQPNPLNIYGRSKLAGELAIQASGCRYLILRTSWVYAESGKNFLMTMLQLVRARKHLRVVDDQHGAPTSSRMLADAAPAAICAVIRNESLGGIYHMTARGRTTWCDFAKAIFQASNIPASVAGISSADYPTPACRPRNSLLDNTRLETKLGIRLPTWEDGLRDVLARVH